MSSFEIRFEHLAALFCRDRLQFLEVRVMSDAPVNDGLLDLPFRRRGVRKDVVPKVPLVTHKVACEGPCQPHTFRIGRHDGVQAATQRAEVRQRDQRYQG